MSAAFREDNTAYVGTLALVLENERSYNARHKNPAKKEVHTMPSTRELLEASHRSVLLKGEIPFQPLQVGVDGCWVSKEDLEGMLDDLKSYWETLNTKLIATDFDDNTTEKFKEKMQDALSFTIQKVYNLEEILDSSQKMEKARQYILDFHRSLSNLVRNPDDHDSIVKSCTEVTYRLKLFIEKFDLFFSNCSPPLSSLCSERRF